MRFAAIATLPLLAFASVAAPLEKRADNTQAILSGLKTLESDLDKLDTLVKAAKPDIAGVQNQEQAVEKDLTNITNLANSSSVGTEAESTSIYNEIKNNVQPRVNTVTNDLITNKAAFAGVKSVVKDDLNKLSSLTGSLGSALVSKATGPAKTNGPALTKAIQDKLTSAAAQFS